MRGCAHADKGRNRGDAAYEAEEDADGVALALAALGGGIFVLLCDTLSRTLFAPYEIPVGIVLSLLGGPFFIGLLIKQRGGRIHD